VDPWIIERESVDPMVDTVRVHDEVNREGDSREHDREERQG